MSDNVTLHHGDCLDVLRSLPDNSVDSVVTDPPYGLSFMGKEWDKPKPRPLSGACEECGNDDPTEGHRVCSDCLPVVGDSTHVAADHGGRSMLGHVSKNWHDKGTHSRGYADNDNKTFQAWCEQWSAECLRVLKPGGHMLAFGGTRTWHRLACAVEDAGFEVRDSIAWLYGSGFPKSLNLVDADGNRTGQGTALKPAFEPVVVARKPLTGTVAANVLAHGTGALNIDATRIGHASQADLAASLAKNPGRDGSVTSGVYGAGRPQQSVNTAGRWPANVVLDESQAEALDRQSGRLHTQRPTNPSTMTVSHFGGGVPSVRQNHRDDGDATGASRFFYVAKAPARERPKVDGVAHPTVKPLTLMRWLVRLVTPPGGTVLEPFAGSGTTVEAALLEGFNVIAIEREADYLPLIEARIDRVAAIQPEPEPEPSLFDLGEETA